jgi:hypothetical protein
LIAILITGPVSASAPTEYKEKEKIVQSIQEVIRPKKEELKPFPIGNKDPEVKPVIRVINAPRANLGVLSMTEAEAKAWIIKREGGLTSVNTKSYACGKPQANPCDKLLDFAGVYHAKTVKPWNYSYAEVKAMIAQVPASVQDAWMDRYVAGRYGSYSNARAHWVAKGWY